MYKVANSLASEIFSNIFIRKEVSNLCLRSSSCFQQPQVHTELKGKHSLRYLGPLIWKIIPQRIKNLTCLGAVDK